MTRIIIVAMTVAFAKAPAPEATFAGAQVPKALMMMAGPRLAQTQALDTPSAAKALVPLLKGVRERLRPHVGIVPGTPRPSPFTGTQTTLFSIGIGRKNVPVDPRVKEAIDRLLAWKVEDPTQTAQAVLFDHWLDQLSVMATTFRSPGDTSVSTCDSACVVAKVTEPGEAFGRTRNEREEARDELLLRALGAAVDEVEPD